MLCHICAPMGPFHEVTSMTLATLAHALTDPDPLDVHIGMILLRAALVSEGISAAESVSLVSESWN